MSVSRKSFMVVAVTFCTVLLLAGCGSDNDEDNSIKGTGGNPILPDGEAWIRCYGWNDGEMCEGYIFRADGVLLAINPFFYDGSGDYTGVTPRGSDETWSVNGTRLTINYDYGTGFTFELTVTGETLTLTPLPGSGSSRAGTYFRVNIAE